MLISLLVVPLLGMTATCHPYHYDLEEELHPNCGYQSCPTPIPGKLNVHLVPHSHDDVGWLKTVDQYYFGSKTRIQNAGVQYILDSVVQELIHDPKKKFIYVETAFFWKWWLEQQDHMRHQVKRLVADGQLEFIGGAWSMNDEATTHYQSVIDQFTWGFRKLNDTFGHCGQPKVGWQIDPFGHARETASLMAQMGFDGLFFGRLDYQDKRTRLQNKTMEMIWEGSDSLGTRGDLFAAALFNEYAAPPGFCFDLLCDDDPIVPDPKSAAYNLDAKLDAFLKFVRLQAEGYATRNLLLTMGEDFQYQSAHVNYKNLDLLIRYVNLLQQNGSDVNVFYSTPSCYVKSLNNASIYWPTKNDDFFPYASDQHSYWTGYFTSRPTLKYYERLGNNYLQISKQLAATAHLDDSYALDLNMLREAMGIMQHHDAITGTEKQHVAFDYARILSQAFDKCSTLISDAVNHFMKLDKNSTKLDLKSCHLTNISECSISSESKNFIVTIYNPLSRPVNYYARIPVHEAAYSVRDPKGEELEYQLVPIPESLATIPGRVGKTNRELVFKAEAIPPLGYRAYYVSRKDGSVDVEESTVQANETTEVPEEVCTEQVEEQLVGGDGDIQVPSNGTRITMKPSVHYYIGEVGSNASPERRSSGAYIFRPKGTEPIEMKKDGKDIVHKGKVVTEIHQVFSDWASHVVRQYAGEQYVEIEWLVGPIPVNDAKGKEIVWRYTTPDIDSNDTFYTDSSGRETIKRVKDHRPTWNLEVHEPVSGNYYPVTTDISISNGEAEMTVVVDRAQGGTSLKSGQIELMVHRRLLHDDAFGVGEALNEVAYGKGLVARGHHWIIVGQKSDPKWAQQKRHLQQQKILNSLVLLTDAGSLDFDAWAKSHRLEFSGLTHPLQDNVQILTLEPWKGTNFLLRLENIFEKRESDAIATVDLGNIFSTFDIVSVRETTLGANQWLDEATRLKWKKETNEVGEGEESDARAPVTSPFKVKLKPKEIRTFICQIKPKNLF